MSSGVSASETVDSRIGIHTQRLLALCGMLAPILFTLVVVVLGAITPGYSHVRDVISVLGGTGAPYGVVQDANFVVCGVLLIAYAVGLHRGVAAGRGSRWGPGVLALAGAGLGGAGFFPVATGASISVIDWSAPTSTYHQLSSVVFFLGMIVGMYGLSRRFRHDPRWRGYDRYSRWASVVALGLVLLYSLAGSDGAGILPDGALQRFYIAWVGIWVESTAIHLLRTR